MSIYHGSDEVVCIEKPSEDDHRIFLRLAQKGQGKILCPNTAGRLFTNAWRSDGSRPTLAQEKLIVSTSGASTTSGYIRQQAGVNAYQKYGKGSLDLFVPNGSYLSSLTSGAVNYSYYNRAGSNNVAVTQMSVVTKVNDLSTWGLKCSVAATWDLWCVIHPWTYSDTTSIYVGCNISGSSTVATITLNRVSAIKPDDGGTYVFVYHAQTSKAANCIMSLPLIPTSLVPYTASSGTGVVHWYYGLAKT